QHLVTAVTEEKGTTCWGCGLGLLLPTLGPAFKCGWCGAITNHNLNKTQNQCLLWRRLRDRCFVSFLFGFMLFVICKWRGMGSVSHYFLGKLYQRDCSFSHNDNLGIDDYFHLRSIGIPMRRRTSDDIVGKLYGCGER
ncbi:hypothetical protein Golob_011549, partial [Gossypium lobatum]|nr:hypothetical protein [Gossypium lobatum]